MSEWSALGRFASKLIIGDVAGAATVLAEKPEEKPLPEPAEGDPPCPRRDGDLRCHGHGFGGMCLFAPGEPPKPSTAVTEEPPKP